MSDETRLAAMVAAEKRAEALMAAIEGADLMRAGRPESDIEADIYALARDRFGVENHWHKRIVRSGPNTLTTALDEPPVRTLDADDIIYIDLGPVFEEWEADIGRTYVIGAHPGAPLVAALPRVFDAIQARYRGAPDMTGAELWDVALEAAADAGWRFGGKIAGHIVSAFPHGKLGASGVIWPANTKRLRDPDEDGNARHWILEVHLVEPAGTYGGFYERLL